MSINNVRLVFKFKREYHEVYSIGHGECRHKGDTKLRKIRNEVFANDGYMFHHRWQNYLYSTYYI